MHKNFGVMKLYTIKDNIKSVLYNLCLFEKRNNYAVRWADQNTIFYNHYKNNLCTFCIFGLH